MHPNVFIYSIVALMGFTFISSDLRAGGNPELELWHLLGGAPAPDTPSARVIDADQYIARIQRNHRMQEHYHWLDTGGRLSDEDQAYYDEHKHLYITEGQYPRFEQDLEQIHADLVKELQPDRYQRVTVHHIKLGKQLVWTPVEEAEEPNAEEGEQAEQEGQAEQEDAEADEAPELVKLARVVREQVSTVDPVFRSPFDRLELIDALVDVRSNKPGTGYFGDEIIRGARENLGRIEELGVLEHKWHNNKKLLKLEPLLEAELLEDIQKRLDGNLDLVESVLDQAEGEAEGPAEVESNEPLGAAVDPEALR